jgi:hypothetical protein
MRLEFIKYLEKNWSWNCGDSLYSDDSVELVLDRLDSGDVESLEDTANSFGYTLWSIVPDYRSGGLVVVVLFTTKE